MFILRSGDFDLPPDSVIFVRRKVEDTNGTGGYLFIYLFTLFNVGLQNSSTNSTNKYQQNQIKI